MLIPFIPTLIRKIPRHTVNQLVGEVFFEDVLDLDFIFLEDDVRHLLDGLRLDLSRNQLIPLN